LTNCVRVYFQSFSYLSMLSFCERYFVAYRDNTMKEICMKYAWLAILCGFPFKKVFRLLPVGFRSHALIICRCVVKQGGTMLSDSRSRFEYQYIIQACDLYKRRGRASAGRRSSRTAEDHARPPVSRSRPPGGRATLDRDWPRCVNEAA